jgi:hypothetical protein
MKNGKISARVLHLPTGNVLELEMPAGALVRLTTFSAATEINIFEPDEDDLRAIAFACGEEPHA